MAIVKGGREYRILKLTDIPEEQWTAFKSILKEKGLSIAECFKRFVYAYIAAGIDRKNGYSSMFSERDLKNLPTNIKQICSIRAKRGDV
jgi:hypothetical protein